MTDHPERCDINLMSGAFWGTNPHEQLAWMRQNAPVYFDENSNCWGLTKYWDIRDASKNPTVFSSAQGIRPGTPALPMMIDMDDPEHWQRRKLVNKGFTPKRVRGYEDRVREVVTELIDSVAERGECDFVWDLAAWLPLIMIGDMLGVEKDDRADLMQWSDDMLRGLVGLDELDKLERAANAAGAYAAYAEKVIAARRENPTDDLMSVLVHAEIDGDSLDLDSLTYESLLILIGGDETTRHVISGGGYQLMTHPDQMAKLVADPSKIPTAIEEMLRWVTPIKNMARTMTCDFELRGETLHEGDDVLLLYPSANRDEEVFEDPFTFDIERDPNEHIAFGGFGAHNCLGNNLARLELRVFYEELLARLPDIHLAEDGEPPYRSANFVCGYEAMRVAFTATR